MKETSPLLLKDFVDLSTLSYARSLPEEALGLLGLSLKVWLKTWLEGLFATEEIPYVKGNVHPQACLEGLVYIAEGAVVEPFAYIKGPTYVGSGSIVRHGAYVRGDVFVGKNCVVGHTTEVKGSVFFDGAKAGHFAYVGDSLLGRDVNLGAGTKLANLKLQGREVSFVHPQTHQKQSSGLKKMGAILGDFAQTGCNAVLSPGTLLLPKAMVFPCVHYHGTLEPGKRVC